MNAHHGVPATARDDVGRKAAELTGRAEGFALALVVRCESPTSAKPGARGVITRDGVLTGWIGGGCAQPVVIEESLKAIREGTPRLLRITPHAGSVEIDGIRAYEMACYSGGTMDIFIEPVLPPPQVVILGRSPVARTLARLAKALRYEVVVFAPEAIPADFPEADRLSTAHALDGIRGDQAYVVVSTQGEDDEGAVEAAARSGAAYVAFVASKKKWDAVKRVVGERGIPAARLDRVRAPAGVEIHALEPEEIALSVMAEIVSARRKAQGEAKAEAPGAMSAHSASTGDPHRSSAGTAPAKSGGKPPPPEGKALDPVCGMHVDMAKARHKADHAGKTYYFCCGGCKSSFTQNPAAYV